MIAEHAYAQRVPHSRRVRQSTQQRVARKSRKRYAAISQILMFLSLGLAGLMLYVMLTANLTRLTYAAAKVEHRRGVLLQQTGQLDDRLAALRSDERLWAAAAKLGMRDPASFAVVRVAPAVRPNRAGVALLPTFGDWFAPAGAAENGSVR